MRAGEQAVKVYALREALEHFENSYRALTKIPNASSEQICDAILGWAFPALRAACNELGL
jgi:hypothetical protein